MMAHVRSPHSTRRMRLARRGMLLAAGAVAAAIACVTATQRSLSFMCHAQLQPQRSCSQKGQQADLSTQVASSLRSFASATIALLLTISSPALPGGGVMPTSLPAFAEEIALTREEQQTVDIFQRTTPGVVFVTSEKLTLEDPRSMEIDLVPSGSGSGWVFDAEGHIITNYHVIRDANALTVKFIDGSEVEAQVIGADPGSDVAVLQVKLPASRESLLKPLERGSSAPIRVGQEVFAIGNPFGLDHTLTKGIVSGVGRTINSVGGRPIQGAIQTDASINPGNSGGPLLDSRGKVIGMNTAIYSPSGASAGVGFAIPSDTVVARATSILKYGYVKRPSLGLYLGQDGLAQRLSGKNGGVVAGIQRVSAASQAGMRVGDIICKIDQRPVKRINDIYAELDEHQPGDVVTVKVLRAEDPEAAPYGEVDYKELTLKVQLLEAPLQGPSQQSTYYQR